MEHLDSSKIKILVCCHKTCELPQDELFLPIQVGAAISDVDLGMQRDDQVNGEICDNISAKNKSYCELTAMYWAWKNIKKLYPNLEYIGLNHYRRYFKFNNIFSRVINYREEDSVVSYELNQKRIRKIVSSGKIIITAPVLYPFCNAVNYSSCHISEDLHTIEKIVHNHYPEYDKAMFDFFYKQNKLSPCNMFIASWDFFDAYCSWLFPILSEAEKCIDISNYSDLQKRIWGFITERLFNVYLIQNNMKVEKLPVYVYNNSKESFFHYYLNRFRYRAGFLITKRIKD